MKIHSVRWSTLASAVLALGVNLSLPATAGDISPVSHDRDGLQSRIEALASRARPGVLGIVVLDLQSGAKWRVNANRAYPMMSVFKAPLGATVLDQVDRGQLKPDQTVVLTRADLSDGTSVIRDEFHGDKMAFTVQQLLVDAVSRSDNTAADALVRLVGGPEVVTSFLRAHGINDMRVDLDEAGVSKLFNDLGAASQLPANETPLEQKRRLERGYKAYLADPRNRSTPEAAVAFLQKLWDNKLISPASTQRLLGLMYAQTIPNRLRNGISADVRLADKCGTSYSLDGITAAYNDIGIMTGPGGRTAIVASFLTASHAPQTEREAIFTQLGQDVAKVVSQGE